MIYRFDDCEFDSHLYTLQRFGKTKRLSRKLFASLLYLLEHRDKVVSKQELAENVWPGLAISDATLESTIRNIRRALGDTGKAQRIIQTLPGYGYRFIAPLTAPSVQSEVHEAPASCSIPGPTPVHLVGRQEAFQQLQHALARAQRGERQIVFIGGEPGIGKTTLVDTFLGSLGEPQSLLIGRGQCIEHYGEGEAYLPVFEALRQLSQHIGHEPFVAWLGRYAPTWLAQMPFLVKDTAWATLQQKVQGATQQRMLRELAEAIEAGTGNQPGTPPLLIFVLEDLQWSDFSTVDLLSLLAQRREPVRLLVIGTYRPADVLAQAHPLRRITRELQRHRQCHELLLPGLTVAAIDEYLQQRFPESAFPSALGTRLHQWTEGNPFFLVTLLKEWEERGILQQIDGEWELEQELDTVAAAVPESIRQMIELQIERLTPQEQQMMQGAGVAGMEFSTASVAASLPAEIEQVEELCASLARRQLFLLASGTTTWPDGTVAATYRFQHALQHKICYELVPPARRRQLHLRIGTYEEQGYGAQKNDHAAALALHFAQGGDARKALHYAWQAGNNAMARYAHHEAIRHWRNGLSFLAALPDAEEQRQQELTLLTALGPALIATRGYAASEVERVYARALELCQQHEESPRLLRVCFGLHAFYLMRGQFTIASQLAEKCFHLAQRLEGPSRLLQAHWAMGLSYFYTGRLMDAREHLQHVIASSQAEHSSALQDPGVTSRAYDALALWLVGCAEQAVERSQQALLLAQQLGHPFSRAWALSFAAMLYYLLRQESLAQAYAEQAIALCRQQKFALYLAMNMMIRGWALTMQGQTAEGIAAIQQGLEQYQATGAALSIPTYLILLAEAYQHSGQPEQALAQIAAALDIVQKTAERLQESELYRLKGELLLVYQQHDLTEQQARALPADPLAEAERCFRQARAIAQAQDAKFLELRAVFHYSRLKLQQGERQEARQMLETTLQQFSEGFDTPDLQRAREFLEQLS